MRLWWHTHTYRQEWPGVTELDHVESAWKASPLLRCTISCVQRCPLLKYKYDPTRWRWMGSGGERGGSLNLWCLSVNYLIRRVFLFLSQKKLGQHECAGRLEVTDAERRRTEEGGPPRTSGLPHVSQARCPGDILNSASSWAFESGQRSHAQQRKMGTWVKGRFQNLWARLCGLQPVDEHPSNLWDPIFYVVTGHLVTRFPKAEEVCGKTDPWCLQGVE